MIFWVGHSTQRRLNFTYKRSCFSVRDTNTFLWKFIRKFPGICFGRYHDRKMMGKISHTEGKTSKQMAKYIQMSWIFNKRITNLNDSLIRKHKSHHQGFIWNLVELQNEKDSYLIWYCSLWTSIRNPNVMSSRNRIHGYKLRLFWDNNIGLLWHI